MAATGLTGPIELSDSGIDRNVSTNRIGAYALGHVDTDDSFVVVYVGRSDEDLAGRLKKHVGKYKVFKYGYLQSALAAFQKECNLYHDFNPPDNKIHPDRPKNSTATCPRCSALG